MEMSERYLTWINIFKQAHEHSPTKEEIDLIAAQHIKEEFYRLHNLHLPEKEIPKPEPKVRLKRTFDERDCIPQLFLKKHRSDQSSASGSKTPPRTDPSQTSQESPLRRSPRKHPSSSSAYLPPSSPRKSPKKPSACRSLTSLFQTKAPEDIQEDFVLPATQPGQSTAELESDEQLLRRSPRKHPSSCPEVLLSPQKPMLLSQPIICSRVGSLLSSISDAEEEKENSSVKSPSQAASKEDEGGGDKEEPEETGEVDSDGDIAQPYPDEVEYVKRKMRKKNENYRRLKMKKIFVRGTSDAKKKFRKWRKNRLKR